MSRVFLAAPWAPPKRIRSGSQRNDIIHRVAANALGRPDLIWQAPRVLSGPVGAKTLLHLAERTILDDAHLGESAIGQAHLKTRLAACPRESFIQTDQDRVGHTLHPLVRSPKATERVLGARWRGLERTAPPAE